MNRIGAYEKTVMTGKLKKENEDDQQAGGWI